MGLGGISGALLAESAPGSGNFKEMTNVQKQATEDNEEMEDLLNTVA